MAIDDSFKKEGTVPFKWEIRPGVPKIQQQQGQRSSHDRLFQLQQWQSSDHSRSFPSTSQKLKPPPSGLYFQAPPERHARSSRSIPQNRAERHRFDRPILAQPECVSPGCFPTPLRRKDNNKKGIRRPKPEFESEPDYTSDLDTLSRWSGSTRRFISPFRDSPSSASFSSYRSSPRPVSDVEWAGFGLF
ncbi:uncharacterized protein LOC132273248 [Cornus florida]|uniref:uncharacterized protein LOC132273248 n=1 Tax=Cornus florida TaxID=4283 RepID=UPI00289A8385|nr:uncharacterized protein LOC132273248 [Cornus florida]